MAEKTASISGRLSYNSAWSIYYKSSTMAKACNKDKWYFGQLTRGIQPFRFTHIHHQYLY